MKTTLKFRMKNVYIYFRIEYNFFLIVRKMRIRMRAGALVREHTKAIRRIIHCIWCSMVVKWIIIIILFLLGIQLCQLHDDVFHLHMMQSTDNEITCFDPA